MLTPRSVRADEVIRDTEDLKIPLEALGLNWQDWLLVTELEVREFKLDRMNLSKAEELLQQSQKKLADTNEELNKMKDKKYEIEQENYKLKERVIELENTPWYRHPVFWACVGVAGGVVLTSVVIAPFVK